MSVWMELLLNIIGFAGFIAIATWNNARPAQDDSEPFRGNGG
jgi:hypothetical protein